MFLTLIAFLTMGSSVCLAATAPTGTFANTEVATEDDDTPSPTQVTTQYTRVFTATLTPAGTDKVNLAATVSLHRKRGLVEEGMCEGEISGTAVFAEGHLRAKIADPDEASDICQIDITPLASGKVQWQGDGHCSWAAGAHCGFRTIEPLILQRTAH